MVPKKEEGFERSGVAFKLSSINTLGELEEAIFRAKYAMKRHMSFKKIEIDPKEVRIAIEDGDKLNCYYDYKLQENE